MMICPFCGKTSDSNKYCTKCNALFNDEIRQIAYTEDNDPRSDYIGPFKNKTATRLLIAATVGLLIVFVVLTEMLL